MKNIIKSTKNSTIYLLIVLLSGCAGMTDADWEALGAAAASIDKSIPSKSKSSQSRSNSSSSSSYSSNSQSTPSYSSESSSSGSYTSKKIYIPNVNSECMVAKLLPRERSDFQQWVSMTNKCNFLVNLNSDLGHNVGDWTPGVGFAANKSETKWGWFNVSKRSSFQYQACKYYPTENRQVSSDFEKSTGRCYYILRSDK